MRTTDVAGLLSEEKKKKKKAHPTSGHLTNKTSGRSVSAESLATPLKKLHIIRMI